MSISITNPADEVSTATETHNNTSNAAATEITAGKPVTTQAPADFPVGYLEYGYKTAEGKCDLRFVSSYAIEIATKLAPMDKERFRAFYRELDLSVREPLDEKQKLLHQLTARAYKIVQLGKAPKIFWEFMKYNAEMVVDHKSYSDFLDHVEAVYCFMN